MIGPVPDRNLGSASGSEQNCCQIGCPGCQSSRTVNSGMVRWKSPSPSGLGGLLLGHSASPSVNLYNALVFAVR